MTRNTFTATIVALLVLVTPACTDAPAAAPAPTPPAPPVTTPTPTPAPTPTVPATLVGHWTGEFSLDLGDGWSLEECLGDAPDICVLRDGEVVGNLELHEYPLEADAGEDEERTRAEDFLRFFQEDRAQGCPDFTFEADPIEDAVIGGQDGLVTGFRLVAGDGRVVERVINYFVVHDGAMFLVNLDAYALEGGCLEESEVTLEFEPDVLAAFERYVGAIVTDTPLPDATIVG